MQLLLTTTLLSELPLTLFLGLAGSLQLLGDETVDLLVEGGLLLLLLGDEPTYCLLFTLQACHKFLLIFLLLLQTFLLLLAASQQRIQLVAGVVELSTLLLYLLTLLLHSLALCTLISGIFVHEAHATIHLVEVLRTKHKNHLIYI